jgi:putative transposase
LYGRFHNRIYIGRTSVLHAESDGILGAGRICEDLRDEGEQCSLNRVARLMREDEIQGIPCKKKHRSKLPDARPDDIQNRLARDFAADEPNTK